MQLKIKREKHGHNQFRLSVRAEFTSQEQHQLQTHDDIARYLIYHNPDGRQFKDLNHKDNIAIMLWKAIMGNPGGNEVKITAKSLGHGHILQGFLGDITHAENEIRSNSEKLLDRLDVGDLYHGEEQVVELGRKKGVVARAGPPLEKA